MVGPFDYAIWLLGLIAEIGLVARAVVHRYFLRYFGLNLYLFALAFSTVCRLSTFEMYGLSSLKYRYCYFYTDSLVTIVMYFAIMGLYLHVFEEMRVNKYIRGLAVVILVGAAGYSFLVVQRDSSSLINGRFVIELAQNLYFIGFVMTYILWGALLKLRVTRLRLILLVSAFGIFFALHAATYGLRNLWPGFPIWRVLPPLISAWLLLSLAYTFVKVPEEARIATARVAGKLQ
jgi:hypothetical protein